MIKKPDLTGAWEERGVIGTRIEIDGSRITVLWRNSPVLETKYKAKETENGFELILKRNGLRYTNAASDYATLTSLVYCNGKLEITKSFPITGESKDVLERTENSRYGNYTVVNEILRELQGEWINESGTESLIIKGDSLTTYCGQTRIVLLRSDSCYSDTVKIADADPSVYELPGFFGLEYYGGVISGNYAVLDAPPMKVTYKRKDK